MKIKTPKGIIKKYMELCGFRGWTSFWNTVYIMPVKVKTINLLLDMKKNILNK